jgi:hypothetical protein
VADTRDTPISFAFDTADQSRTLRPTTSETRDMPAFSFERYTRDRQQWKPKTAWPTTPKSGDWRCTMLVTNPKLVMTGYQYAGTAATISR